MADLLKGGTALITGSASGIGRATAKAFAGDGCSNLILCDISVDGLKETEKLILDDHPDVAILSQHADVGVEESIEKLYAAGVAKFGRIDFVANVAGTAHPTQPVTNMTPEQFQRTYNVNIRGLFMSERAALRQMIKQEPLAGFEHRGSIVNVGSVCSFCAMPGLSVYSGSKGAVLGLTRTDAIDFGPRGIRVNMVAPGNTVTPLLHFVMGEHNKQRSADNTPLRRHADPADVANAIVFLSSPRANFITGATLTVDGGLTLATGPS